jgi:hypothetical protein
MTYNKNDKHLQDYKDKFNTNKTAFVLKPDNLLYNFQSKIYENVTKPILYK